MSVYGVLNPKVGGYTRDHELRPFLAALATPKLVLGGGVLGCLGLGVLGALLFGRGGGGLAGGEGGGCWWEGEEGDFICFIFFLYLIRIFV